jgi:hypothetical protein
MFTQRDHCDRNKIGALQSERNKNYADVPTAYDNLCRRHQHLSVRTVQEHGTHTLIHSNPSSQPINRSNPHRLCRAARAAPHRLSARQKIDRTGCARMRQTARRLTQPWLRRRKMLAVTPPMRPACRSPIRHFRAKICASLISARPAARASARSKASSRLLKSIQMCP